MKLQHTIITTLVVLAIVTGWKFVEKQFHKATEEPLPPDIVLDAPPPLNYKVPDFSFPEPRNPHFKAPEPPPRAELPTIPWPETLKLPEPPSVQKNELQHAEQPDQLRWGE